MSSRSKVCQAIDGERYQDSIWNENTASKGRHKAPAWWAFMRHYLDLAEATVPTTEATEDTMHIACKLSLGCGVYMEQHGAPLR